MRKETKFRKFTQTELKAAAQVAKMVAYRCVRDTSIETIHQGTIPSSKAGDYSDVKVVTPYGEIPWDRLSRINQDEMKAFNKEVINKIFTFLLYLNADHEIPVGPHAFFAPDYWDEPEIDSSIVKIFERNITESSD